jgi:membrane fusion protein, heavy metal efflux system
MRNRIRGRYADDLPRMVRRLLIAAGLIVAAAPWAAAHEGHEALPSTGATVDGDRLLISNDAIKAVGLQTGAVTLDDLQSVLHVQTRVELPPAQQAIVTALFPGRIERVLVEPGETVRAGQELVRIEGLELESLQTELLNAATELERLEQLAARHERLAAAGALSGRSLLDVRTERERKAVERVVAFKKLQAIGMDETTIGHVLSTGRSSPSLSVFSPRAGVVGQMDVRAGQSVDLEDRLFQVIDGSTLWVVAEILETDLAHFAAHLRVNDGDSPNSPVGERRDESVRVAFAGMSESFSGRIDHLRLKMDTRRRMLQAVIPVDNSAGTLRPGMFGRASIEIRLVREAIVCPAEAIIETPTDTFVLKRDGAGKYLRRPVKIGLRVGDRVEVLDGLFPGDRVVVTGNHVLANLFEAAAGDHSDGRASKRPPPIARGDKKPLRQTQNGDRINAAHAQVELSPQSKALAAPLLSGRIAQVFVEAGRPVRAGQLLAELESRTLYDLKLEWLELQGRQKWTHATVERMESLAPEGVTPQQDLQRRQTELKTIGQRLASLRRRLALAGLTPEQIEQIATDSIPGRSTRPARPATIAVRAPADGWLAEFDVVQGQAVGPQAPLFEIHALETVWVRANLFERDAFRVRAGQRADVTFPALPNVRLEGRVVRTAPLMTESGRVLPVWIEVDNPGRLLREGMSARAVIDVSQQPAVPSNRKGAGE